jgi:hypothetical protein
MFKLPQSRLIEAMDEMRPGERKWWASELGTWTTRLSEYAHGKADMPEAMQEAAFATIARERPDLAAELAREVLRPLGLAVEPVARPEPAATSRRANSAVAREFADLTAAWAEADEDGHHDAPELARRLREAGAAPARDPRDAGRARRVRDGHRPGTRRRRAGRGCRRAAGHRAHHAAPGAGVIALLALTTLALSRVGPVHVGGWRVVGEVGLHAFGIVATTLPGSGEAWGVLLTPGPLVRVGRIL